MYEFNSMLKVFLFCLSQITDNKHSNPKQIKERGQLIAMYINPLSPNVYIQILQTDLHTSPLRISWENLIKDHGIFSMMIILLILITLSLDSEWILLGENCCWSLLALKWFKWKSLITTRNTNPNSQEKTKEAVDILWDTHHSAKLFIKEYSW